MGQNASKGLRRAAEQMAKKGIDNHLKPPLPTRTPPTNSSAAVAKQQEQLEVFQPPPPLPANPGNFLRGDGIAKEDVRDVGQEMYLQHAQKLSEQYRHSQEQEERDQQPHPQSPPSASGDDSTDGKPSSAAALEMPADLLKFIQDVGPVRQAVDQEFTTRRLLEKENVAELEKVESVRKPIRQRRKIPLIGQDERFTTEKNTYFTHGDETTENPVAKAVPYKDFGLENLAMYDLLSQKANKTSHGSSDDQIVQEFCRTRMPVIESQQWTDEEINQFKALLQQTLESIEIPTLRMDSEGHILGLYSKEVPGPEIKAVSIIPETKIMLVLKDLELKKEASAYEVSAADKLMGRRLERKASSNR